MYFLELISTCRVCLLIFKYPLIKARVGFLAMVPFRVLVT